MRFETPLIIGDRLNLANRSARRDSGGTWSRIEQIKAQQIANGAAALDVCASGAENEVEELSRLLALDGPSRFRRTVWCIDSIDADVISAIVPRLSSDCILNCCSAFTLSSPDVPAALQQLQGSIAAVVALCLDDKGTRTSAVERIAIAERMADALDEVGIGADRIIFDPVTVPHASGREAMETMLQTAALLRSTFPNSGVLCASSNYSYGLRDKSAAEQEIVREAKDAGASLFLCNALDAELCRLIRS